MYSDIPIWLALAFVAVGLYVLAWSADRFVGGAEAVSRALGVSPFIVGMVIVGFGTSAPELAVSALSGMAGHPNLSLGNAYDSNIFNIAAILGVAVLISPITVRPVISFAAVPMLLVASVASCMFACLGGGFSRMDGLLCLALFGVLLPAYCYIDRKGKSNVGVGGIAFPSSADEATSCRHPCLALVGGLTLLVASSHILVWGAVGLARSFGVSADARQHNRLKLLQLACSCRNKRGDIAIQGRFAACLHARPARHGPPHAFHRHFWIQHQESSLIRYYLPSLRNHLACRIPCLSDSPRPARSVHGMIDAMITESWLRTR